ncbi:hypothetical protein B0H19DRAFT_1375573 [Mycena capillaripes]|nr:hypothetical protein B0H19DRAFT_1375573 [Mycena capillaripes]
MSDFRQKAGTDGWATSWLDRVRCDLLLPTTFYLNGGLGCGGSAMILTAIFLGDTRLTLTFQCSSASPSRARNSPEAESFTWLDLRNAQPNIPHSMTFRDEGRARFSQRCR